MYIIQDASSCTISSTIKVEYKKTSTTNIKSYSFAVSQINTKIHTKDQAVVFTSIVELRIQDYVIQLGPKVNPKIYCIAIAFAYTYQTKILLTFFLMTMVQ